MKSTHGSGSSAVVWSSCGALLKEGLLTSVVSSSGSLCGSGDSTSATSFTFAACAAPVPVLAFLFVWRIILSIRRGVVRSFFFISTVIVHVPEAPRRYGVTVASKMLSLSLSGYLDLWLVSVAHAHLMRWSNSTCTAFLKVVSWPKYLISLPIIKSRCSSNCYRVFFWFLMSCISRLQTCSRQYDPNSNDLSLERRSTDSPEPQENLTDIPAIENPNCHEPTQSLLCRWQKRTTSCRCKEQAKDSV